MRLPIITIPEQIYRYKNGTKAYAFFFGMENESLLEAKYASHMKSRIAGLITDSFVTEQAVMIPYYDMYCVLFKSNVDHKVLFRFAEQILGELDEYSDGKLGIYYGFTKAMLVEEGKTPGPLSMALTSEELAGSAYLEKTKRMLEHKERRNLRFLANASEVKWKVNKGESISE